MRNKSTFNSFLNSDLFSWNFWGTITTKYHLTNRSARRLVERFFNNLKTKLKRLNKFSSKSRLVLLFVCEPFVVKTGVHIHFLIECANNTNYKYLRECAENALGKNSGIVDIQSIRKSGGCISYCSQKISKGNDYDIFVEKAS